MFRLSHTPEYASGSVPHTRKVAHPVNISFRADFLGRTDGDRRVYVSVLRERLLFRAKLLLGMILTQELHKKSLKCASCFQ